MARPARSSRTATRWCCATRTSARSAGGSAAAELGLALLAEGLRALREVLGASAQLLHRDLELERRGERGARRGVHHPLGEPDRDRGAGEQLVDERLRLGAELLDRGDAVDETDALGLLAAEHL